MIITVDNVEIFLSQSSDKTVTVFVEMRDGQTGRVYQKTWAKLCILNINGIISIHYMPNKLAYIQCNL